MEKKTAMDLTAGKPLKQLVLFSLPLVAGTLFQQFYNFADTVMVGRFIGSDALAAVGATYALYFLTLGFVQGSCVGFGIPLAQSVGAKDMDEFKRYFFNGVWLCLITAGGLTILMQLLAEPLLRLIRTPEDIFREADLYIRIIFLGIPASTLYNFSAGALRATGDSQRPTQFLLVSSILNIILDYILIVPIPLGVAGAALATVLSQLVSGLLNLYWLIFRTDCLHSCRGYRSLSGQHIRTLCRVGYPMGFDHSVSALGMVIMQYAINSLGTAAVTGQASGEKIRQMFTVNMEAIGMGMATYAGQNDGAKRYDRIKEGIRAGLMIQYSFCALAWTVIFFGKGAFTALVLGPDAGEAGRLSVQYLAIISCLFPIHGSLMIIRNTLQGMGYSLHAVFSGVAEMIGRALGCWLTIAYLGFFGVCIANPIAWSCGLIYCGAILPYFLKKRQQQNQ